MRICIFGAGAIGGMLGSLLKKNGADVVLIARGEHYKAIKKNGLIFTSKEYDLDICQQFDIYDNVDNIDKFDLVINGLKAHSSCESAHLISRLMHNKTILLPTLNGIPWWFFYKIKNRFKDYKLKSVDPTNSQWEYLKPSRVIGSVVYPAATIKAPGLIEHIEGKRFIIGEPDDTKSERVLKLSKLFMTAGIKAPVSKNIRNDIWLKLLGNSSFNPLSIITKGTLKELCENQNTRMIVKKMMEETIEIGSFFNIETKLDIESRIEGARKVGNHKTSTLQDYEKKKPLELDALIKSLIEMGKIAEINTPTLNIIFRLANYLEEKNKVY